MPRAHLDSALAIGRVWRKGKLYYGRASDGAIVTLGHVAALDALELFLSLYPSPEDWT